VTAPARRSAPGLGRSSKSNHHQEADPRGQATTPVQIRDPQRIAGAELAKYGIGLSHQISCELASLVDMATHGRPAENPKIPEPYKASAAEGLRAARAALAEARERGIAREGASFDPRGTRGGGRG
jgi:hypothetical protein